MNPDDSGEAPDAMEDRNDQQGDDANTFVLDREHVFVCYRVEHDGNVIEVSAAVPFSEADTVLSRDEFAAIVLKRLMAASEQPRDQ